MILAVSSMFSKASTAGQLAPLPARASTEVLPSESGTGLVMLWVASTIAESHTPLWTFENTSGLFLDGKCHAERDIEGVHGGSYSLAQSHPCFRRQANGLECHLLRFSGSMVADSAPGYTHDTLSTVFLIGPCVCWFPGLNRKIVWSVRARIGFNHFDLVAPLVAIALDDEPTAPYEPAIIPAKQPGKCHAAGIFQLRSDLADKSLEAPIGLAQPDDLCKRVPCARLHYVDQLAHGLAVLVSSDCDVCGIQRTREAGSLNNAADDFRPHWKSRV
jgi:hypothetical protein